jgi:hypothetical protein
MLLGSSLSRRAGRAALFAAACMVACGTHGGSDGAADGGPGPGDGPGGGTAATGTFTDDFKWSGTHAAVVGGGKGTTVFMNASQWDVTGDTHAIAVMGEWSNTTTPNQAGLGLTNTNSGHAVTIHHAAHPCDRASTGPCDGTVDDATLVSGGDGSPGVRAPRFVTLGHWWELALTPADRVIGAENTVVESQGQGDGLGDPGGKPNSPGKGAGPGHDPQEESFNVVFTGHRPTPTAT